VLFLLRFSSAATVSHTLRTFEGSGALRVICVPLRRVDGFLPYAEAMSSAPVCSRICLAFLVAACTERRIPPLRIRLS